MAESTADLVIVSKSKNTKSHLFSQYIIILNTNSYNLNLLFDFHHHLFHIIGMGVLEQIIKISHFTFLPIF